MNQQPSAVLRIPLSSDGEMFEFFTADDIQRFVESERKAWEWLNKPNDSEIVPLVKGLRPIVLDNILQQLDRLRGSWPDNQNQKEKLESNFDQALDTIRTLPFPFSRSAVGRFILDTQETSQSIAVMMLYAECYSTHTPTTPEAEQLRKQYHQLGRGNNNFINYIQRNAPVVMQASHRLSVFRNGHSNEHQTATRSAANRYVDDLKKARNDAEIDLRSFTSWRIDATREHEERLSDTYKRTIKRTRTLMRSLVRDARAMRDQGQAALDALRSQVEFSETVGYWNTKEGAHRESRRLWGFVLTLAALCIIALPWLIGRMDPIYFGNIPMNLYLFDAIHPIKASVIVLVISITSYLTRFSSRQFATHQHLMLEAIERQTMLKTYIGLMLANKLNEAEDRKIALDTLFRPGQTGIVEDPGGVTPSDSIVRIVERQAPTAGS